MSKGNGGAVMDDRKRGGSKRVVLSDLPEDQPLYPGSWITGRQWSTFIRLYTATKDKQNSAKGAGFTPNTVRNLCAREDEVGEMCRADVIEAEHHFLAELERTALELAIDGEKIALTNPKTGDFVYLTDPITKEFILGPDGKPQVAYTNKRDSRMVQFLLRHMSDKYSDRREVNHTVSGGVLVVPAPVGNHADWEAKYSDQSAGPLLEHEGDAD